MKINKLLITGAFLGVFLTACSTRYYEEEPLYNENGMKLRNNISNTVDKDYTFDKNYNYDLYKNDPKTLGRSYPKDLYNSKDIKNNAKNNIYDLEKNKMYDNNLEKNKMYDNNLEKNKMYDNNNLYNDKNNLFEYEKNKMYSQKSNLFNNDNILNTPVFEDITENEQEEGIGDKGIGFKGIYR